MANLTAPLELAIPVNGVVLGATLTVPPGPVGVVLFAHGSGSSRLSPRNRHVASALLRRHLATLVFDLQTVAEERFDFEDATLRPDVDFLAERLIAVTDWARRDPSTTDLPLIYFGSGSGGAVALRAAARRPDVVTAVVTRGGRVDLAGDAVAAVRAPVLMIVGSEDRAVLAACERTAPRLAGPHEIVVIPEASHLFEEPGALDRVARLAGDWLHAQLAEPRPLAAS